MKTLLTPKEIELFFEDLAAHNPHPKGELYSTNSFTLLVAVVLSAQATDKGVNKATNELFKRADTPQKMLDLGEENLKRYINTIGLYNTKARNIISLCQKLISNFGGNVPEKRGCKLRSPGHASREPDTSEDNCGRPSELFEREQERINCP